VDLEGLGLSDCRVRPEPPPDCELSGQTDTSQSGPDSAGDIALSQGLSASILLLTCWVFTRPRSPRVGLARRGFALASPVYEQPQKSAAQFVGTPEISSPGAAI